ncbi:hypothetical protein HK096_006724, partial [Nowakowskiella sp. JEL0078]
MYSMYYNNFDTANNYVAQLEILASTDMTSTISSAVSISSSGSDTAAAAVNRNGRQVAKKFRNYMRKVKLDPRHNSQISLQSFLILPVQRLPRYKLLIDELLQATPSTHPDYENLRKAAEEVRKRVLECNEKKRAWEEREKGLGVLARIKVREPSVGFLEKLRVVTEGRRFIREFVGRVLKVVEVNTSSVAGFGGMQPDFNTGSSELQLLAMEGIQGVRNLGVDSKKSSSSSSSFDAAAVAAAVQRIDKQLAKSRYNEKNTFFAANLKKDRYSTAIVGPLVEIRFIGRKDEDERSRDVRLSQEAYRGAIITARENRLVLGDIGTRSSRVMADNMSINSSSTTGSSNFDAHSVYNTSRTSGREFRFFLFSDVLCWCKFKDNESDYDLVRAISIGLQPNAEQLPKDQTDGRKASSMLGSDSWRWPAEIMEVYHMDEIGNTGGGFGRWTTSARAGSGSVSINSVGAREAVARISDTECVVYVRGEYDMIVAIVEQINAVPFPANMNKKGVGLAPPVNVPLTPDTCSHCQLVRQDAGKLSSARLSATDHLQQQRLALCESIATLSSPKTSGISSNLARAIAIRSCLQIENVAAFANAIRNEDTLQAFDRIFQNLWDVQLEENPTENEQIDRFSRFFSLWLIEHIWPKWDSGSSYKTPGFVLDVLAACSADAQSRGLPFNNKEAFVAIVAKMSDGIVKYFSGPSEEEDRE